MLRLLGRIEEIVMRIPWATGMNHYGPGGKTFEKHIRHDLKSPVGALMSPKLGTAKWKPVGLGFLGG